MKTLLKITAALAGILLLLKGLQMIADRLYADYGQKYVSTDLQAE
ncbi:MAG: hypothetical protein ACOX60_00370 [Massiliimalia sp.]|jgi:hypothetical protein